MRVGVLVVSLIATVTVAAGQTVKHPETRKVDQVDDYFGTKIADPYRWLEDDDSAETAAWVAAQNKATFAFLEQIPEREKIKARVTTLWNYERFGVPSREAEHYVFSRNSGLQNQAVVYKTRTLDAPPEMLLDPNTFSTDGTVSLAASAFSDDGRLMAYAKSVSGSDWREWRVRDVLAVKDLDDVVKWSKFSGASWLKDGSGFFYSRFAAPKPGEELQAVNLNQKVYFHKVGTPQDADVLVYERPDHPKWNFNAEVTEDGRFLLIYQGEGTERENRIFVRDLRKPGSPIEPFLDRFDASYQVVGNDDLRFYVLTDQGAPRNRLVAIERTAPEPETWKTLIPEGPNKDVLASVTMVGNRFIATWLVDAQEKLRAYRIDGSLEREIALPGIGSVARVNARRRDREAFYAFTSFTYPTTIFRYEPEQGESSVFKKPAVTFTPEAYETKQLFYTSKDGTRVPMFVTHRKDLVKNGQNPTLLYGYGGFNISLTPGFSPANAAWLDMGGIYVAANLRGGGEYGKAWHEGGRLANKQNVFDDFIAAAEFLIKEGYTSTPKLAIAGGSNGGLLVGAVITQRPELVGAALPAVGVMDMLRFHQFTIGWMWKSDFGSAETKEGFDTLIKYSPLHNIEPGTKYPATLITTADHDDRVVPAHSFKFAAALQAAQAGPAPILIRIETKAGHGAGKSTTQQIEERGDVLAFLTKVLGMQQPAATARAAQ